MLGVSRVTNESYPRWCLREEVRERVFDPFFTTKMGRGGTGLGMHIVHTIVTRVLRGQITVTSQVGVGTQVRVVFPRELPDESAPQTLPSAFG